MVLAQRVIILWLSIIFVIATAATLGRAWPDDVVLFEGDRRDGMRDLYLRDVSSSAYFNLTRTPDASETFAEWSPDGRHISYLRGSATQQKICIQRSAHPLPRCAEIPGALAIVPRWTRNGEAVWFFSTVAEANVRLFEYRPETDVILDIRQVPAFLDAAWSLDGRWIVLLVGQALPHLYVMSPDSDVPIAQLFEDDAAEALPSFSPDGRWLALIRAANFRSDIYLIPTTCFEQPDTCGDAMVRLTSRESAYSPLAWSADSRQLVYTSRVGDSFQIFTLDIALGVERQRTHDARQYGVPRLSPDGQSMVYLAEAGAGMDVFVRALDEASTPVPITDNQWDNWSPQWRPHR